MTFDEITNIFFVLMGVLLLLTIAALIGGMFYFLKAREHYEQVRRRLGFYTRDADGRLYRDRERK